MSGDRVLSELRAWRDEFARSHGYDLAAMAAALRAADATAGPRLVVGLPRRPERATPRPPEQAEELAPPPTPAHV